MLQDLTNMEKHTDSVVESIITKFKQRSELGFKKYNKTLDRTDLTYIEWVNHLQEELMDAILYAEKLKQYANTKF